MLFSVDITNAQCSATTYVSEAAVQAPYTMSFVKDTPTNATETLYVAELVVLYLGKFDLEKLELNPIGATLKRPDL